MLSPRLVPTRLVDPADGVPIHIAEATPPSRLRMLSIAAALIGFLSGLAALRLRGELHSAAAGARLRHCFERLGGLWLKIGQLLSLRIDLFPIAFCRELATLQHSSTGFSTARARRIIEEDLGGPLERYFDEFGDRPFAVASIGQVHRARLRQEGVEVAVKVQKPYAPQLFERDLVFVRWLVRLLRAVRFWPHMRWDLGYEELCGVMKEELDYHYEASSIRRMKKSLRGHRIYVPRLFARYSSKRVLVTEFIDAVPMADYIRIADTDPERLAAWLHANDIRPRKAARRLIHSIFRQLLEDNLYHGDLHPGNIILLRHSRIALIDFGSTSFTEREYLQKFRMFIRALATRDYAKGADLCLMLTASLPIIDTSQVKEELVRALRAWATRTLVRELPYHDKSIDNATIEVVKILVAHRCTMEWAWLRIHRALTTLDTSLIYLYSGVNYTRRLRRYFRAAEGRTLRAVMGPEMVRRSLGALNTSLNIQDRINGYTLFQGTLVRRHAQVFRDATGKIGAVWRLLAEVAWTAIFAAGALGALVYLEQRQIVSISPRLGPQLAASFQRVPVFDAAVWIIIAAIYIYIVRVLARLRQRLRRKDVGIHERVAPL